MDEFNLPAKVRDELGPPLLTLRIIVFALLMGVAMYAAIVVFVLEPPAQPGDNPLMAQILAGFAAILIVTRMIVPPLMFRATTRAMSAPPKPGASAEKPTAAADARELIAAYQTKTIVAGALLEGGAFGNLIAYQTQREPYSLVIALLLMLGIAALFPLRGPYEARLARQLRDLEDARSLHQLR